MPNRPADQPNITPTLVSSDPLLREIADMLAYLDLHLGRYQWKQLTTRQKELFADLIDSSLALHPDLDGSPGYEPGFTPRWWRDDFNEGAVAADPEWRAPDPFA